MDRAYTAMVREKQRALMERGTITLNTDKEMRERKSKKRGAERELLKDYKLEKRVGTMMTPDRLLQSPKTKKKSEKKPQRTQRRSPPHPL